MTEVFDSNISAGSDTTPEAYQLKDGKMSDHQRTFVQKYFREAMNPEFSGNPTFKDYPDMDSWAKSHISREKMIGANKVAIPGQNATPEEVHAYYRAVGKPDKVEEYKLSLEGMNIPDELHPTDEQKREFAKWAHENHFTNAQAQALFASRYTQLAKYITDSQTRRNANMQAGWEAVKKEYGPALEQKRKNANAVLAMFDKSGELTKLLNQSGLINHPLIFKFAADVADYFAEDKLPQRSRTTGAMTPKQAEQKANDMLMDEKGPLMNKSHPNHKDAVETYSKLMEIAAGGK